MGEGHPRVTVPTRIQGDVSVRKLDKLQVAILILDQNHPNVGTVRVRISLYVLTRRDSPVAHVAGSDEIPNHDLLDGDSRKG